MYVFFLWWVFFVFLLERRVQHHRAMVHGLCFSIVWPVNSKGRVSQKCGSRAFTRNTEDSLPEREVVNNQITITEDIAVYTGEFIFILLFLQRNGK